MPESWTIRHFAQADDDVAELLRRVAVSIEDLDRISVHDITFGIGSDSGPRYRLTVYFNYEENDGPPTLRSVE